ncbi:hypothetical protein FDP41_006839 [Naegleria fowleri]|uniref:Uncharacterized protein n=1 Tax=Naegleria fowleri TaxID=5763 RepID=A0A6A5BMU0_NAEFO|nr:uncharacterized protein FDP41_006839 [Naegleria fowleri]KAF0974229.1 hypothetical protein FDP41_006839 [Naegleria fowleri]CAG4709045.1 unnamed protein product [Naegleria fowleri]
MFSSRSAQSTLSKSNQELERRKKNAVFLGDVDTRSNIKQISLIKTIREEFDVYYSSRKCNHHKERWYEIKEPRKQHKSNKYSTTIYDFLNPNIESIESLKAYSICCEVLSSEILSKDAESTADFLGGSDLEFYYFVKLKATSEGKMVILFGELFNVEISVCPSDTSNPSESSVPNSSSSHH